ncbi:MAG TPA: hypothetical protein VG820_11770 [Fimbriimonadaceae bacterium]|nr:hypothetical protein [Fimbriimonadaceae bacterium]
MHSSHQLPTPQDHANAFPTIALAWAHFAIALVLGIGAFTAAIPPMLGILGMGLFAGISMIFALLTLTR